MPLGYLRDSIPKLTRPSLHRCLERRDIGALRLAQGTLNMVPAIDPVSKAEPLGSRRTWERAQADQAPSLLDQWPNRTIKAFHYPGLGSLKAHVLAFVSDCEGRSDAAIQGRQQGPCSPGSPRRKDSPQ